MESENRRKDMENLGKRIFTFPHPAISISGTVIRNLIWKNKNLNKLIPKKVYNYIMKHKLYKEA